MTTTTKNVEVVEELSFSDDDDDDDDDVDDDDDDDLSIELSPGIKLEKQENVIIQKQKD